MDKPYVVLKVHMPNMPSEIKILSLVRTLLTLCLNSTHAADVQEKGSMPKSQPFQDTIMHHVVGRLSSSLQRYRSDNGIQCLTRNQWLP